MRLDDGKIDEEDEPGDKDQGCVMEKVVGDQEQEERAKSPNDAPEEIQQTDVLGPNCEAIHAERDEGSPQRAHHQGEYFFAQEPLPDVLKSLLKGTHECTLLILLLQNLTSQCIIPIIGGFPTGNPKNAAPQFMVLRYYCL